MNEFLTQRRQPFLEEKSFIAEEEGLAGYQIPFQRRAYTTGRVVYEDEEMEKRI